MGTDTTIITSSSSGVARSLWWALVVAIAVAAASFGTFTEGGAQSLDTEELRRVLEETMRAEIADKDIPSIALAMVTPDGTVLEIYQGREGVEVGPETVFRVGSVSKMFTALAAVMASEEGRLDLDAPARSYLPALGSIERETPITVRHLLSHRAGLVREPPVGYYTDPSEPGLDAMVASMQETELVHAVGGQIKYSNAGYGLVGAVLEAVEGRPFGDVIRNRILDPLGMSSSWTVRTDLPPGRLAEAEMWRTDGGRYAPPLFDFGMQPAGFLYTTIPDLSKYMSVLLQGGAPLVDESVLQAMWLPQSEGYDADWNSPCDGTCTRGAMEVGLAADLFRPFEGYTRVRHGGGVYGFATEFAMLPEIGVGVIVVTTLDSMGSVSRNLGDAALAGYVSLLKGRALPEVTTAPNLMQRVSEEIEAARAAREGRTDSARGSFGRPIQAVEVLAETADAIEIVVEGNELVRLERTGPDTFLFPRFSSFGGEPFVLERGADRRVTAVRIGTGRGVRLERAVDGG